MENIKISECREIYLKEAKQIMLDILVDFDKISKEYGLTYWLTAGTLLGAVRHKGFIPWDDDIDICMPREDYEKLSQIDIPKHLFLQNKKTDPKFEQYYTKIRRNNTLFIEFNEKGNNIKYHQGIFIDIFPLNYINKNIISFYPKIHFLIAGVLSNKRFYSIFFNNDLVLSAIQILFYFHNKQNEISIFGLESIDKKLREFDKKYIFPLAEGSFEGYTFPIPKEFNLYLENFFDENFMTLPPESERLIHNYKIFIKI